MREKHAARQAWYRDALFGYQARETRGKRPRNVQCAAKTTPRPEVFSDGIYGIPPVYMQWTICAHESLIEILGAKVWPRVYLH